MRDAIRIPAPLNTHLTQTRDALIDLALQNISSLPGNTLSKIESDLRLTQTDPEQLIRYEPLKDAYQLCEAIELLNNITRHQTLTRDVSDHAQIAHNIIALISLGNHSNIMSSGNLTPHEDSSVDLSLSHLVKTHENDLIQLAVQVTQALPIGNPQRITLLDKLGHLRTGPNIPPMD